MGCGAGKSSVSLEAASEVVPLKESDDQKKLQNDDKTASLEPIIVTPPRPADLSGVRLADIEALHNEADLWLNTPVETECSDQPKRPTMYQVVEHLIRPKTASRQCAYAELFEEREPDVFVSHWWGEEFVLFVTALRKFAAVVVKTRQLDAGGLQPEGEDGDAGFREEAQVSFDDIGTIYAPALDEVVFWVCSLANRQWKVDLGSTLEDSPFERALVRERCEYVVMVVDPEVTPLSRIWCLYEVLRAHALKKKFHMATENGVLTHGTKEPHGKQREDLLNLCRKVLDINAQEARSSKAEDRAHILMAIRRVVGVDQFNIHVKSLLLTAFTQRGGNQLMADAQEIMPALMKVKALQTHFVSFEDRSHLHALAESGTLQEVRAGLQAMCQNRSPDSEEETTGTKLAANGEVNARMTNGQTPLHLAAAFNPDLQVVAALLAARADINSQDKRGLVPLAAGAMRGRASVLRLLIQSRADVVGKRPEEGGSGANIPPLAAATIGSHSESVEVLLEAGAAADTATLTTCCVFGNTGVLRLLLASRAHPDGVGGVEPFREPFKPLGMACQVGNHEAVEALLNAEADVNLSAANGKTALMLASSGGNPDLVSLLLSKRAEPWTQDSNTYEALTYACGGGHVDVAEKLLDLGRSVNQPFADGRCPIHCAAQWGRPRLVEYLVGRGAELDVVWPAYGQTPLMLAAEWGYSEAVQMLASLQADLNKTDPEGQTALAWATERNFRACARLLSQLMAKEKALA